MKVDRETYRGIEFVQISSLPEDQRKLVQSTLGADKTIKILRGEELLVDCLQYEHYENWFLHYYSLAPIQNQTAEDVGGLILAFK